MKAVRTTAKITAKTINKTEMKPMRRFSLLLLLAFVGSPAISQAAGLLRQEELSPVGGQPPVSYPSMEGSVGDDGNASSSNVKEMKKKKKKKKSSAS